MWDFIKKIFKDICSAALDVFMFGAGLILCLGFIGGMLTGYWTEAAIIGVIGISLCLFGSRKLWLTQWQQQREQSKALSPLKTVELAETAQGEAVSDFEQESFDKAIADYNSLNDIIRRLADEELVGQLQKMQGIALKMLNYMKEHPEKIPLADQFINYYQDRAKTLSQQFLEFEEMNLNTKEIAQLKAKTKITLESFDEAYEAQFSRMISDKVMEMESELLVAKQIMSDAGIHNTSERAHIASSNHTGDAQKPQAQTDEPTDFRIERPFDTAEKKPVSQKPRGRFQH